MEQETYQDQVNRQRLEGLRRVNTTAPEPRPDQQWQPTCEQGECWHATDNLPLLLSELLDPKVLNELLSVTPQE